jgi:hypothetical protein
LPFLSSTSRAAQPAGAALDAVAIVIEEDGAGGAHRFDAVAVEVEGQGVAADPAAGGGEEVVEFGVESEIEFGSVGGGHEEVENGLSKINSPTDNRI